MRLIKAITRITPVILIERIRLKVIRRIILKVIRRMRLIRLKVLRYIRLKVLIRIRPLVRRIGPLVVRRIGLIGPLTKVSGLFVSRRPGIRLSLGLSLMEYTLHICPGTLEECIRSNTLLRNSL